MSSSSSPDPRPAGDAVHMDVEEIEQAEQIEHGGEPEHALGVTTGGRERGGGLVTFLWALPGFIWLGFFLVAPLVFIVLVSFWTRTDFGFDKSFTISNYSSLIHDSTYWNNMLTSFETSLIAVAACLILGFPVAYFLAMKVQKLQYQIGLFLLALAPFWTSFLTRSIAWTYPLMGNSGALNQLLTKMGISTIDNPLINTSFTILSVRLAMIQLYILFMITPIFFLLAQVDRHALEAARDLGGNWFQTFREVIVPQTMPGVVIGSIFIFVLTMGEYGTVSVISANTVQSVGTIVNTDINAIQYPQGAASAVVLVLALILGVFVITRFANLREEI